MLEKVPSMWDEAEDCLEWVHLTINPDLLLPVTLADLLRTGSMEHTPKSMSPISIFFQSWKKTLTRCYEVSFCLMWPFSARGPVSASGLPSSCPEVRKTDFLAFGPVTKVSRTHPPTIKALHWDSPSVDSTQAVGKHHKNLARGQTTTTISPRFYKHVLMRVLGIMRVLKPKLIFLLSMSEQWSFIYLIG